MKKFHTFVCALNVIALISALPTEFLQSTDVAEKALSQENSKKCSPLKAFSDDLMSVNFPLHS